MDKDTIQYFIDKFEAIPEEEWTIGRLTDTETGACCALGHCGVREDENGKWVLTDEATKLLDIFGGLKGPDEINFGAVYTINDCHSMFPGNSPKKRILNQLYLKKYPTNE